MERLRKRHAPYFYDARYRPPRTLEANIAFRRKLIAAARDDDEHVENLWKICARDQLFFINSFCFLHEPRPGFQASKVIPFITYDAQNIALMMFRDAMGQRDVLVPKSRDQGGTWMLTTSFAHEFIFSPNSGLCFASRSKEFVDGSGATKKPLMRKLDFQIQNLPAFLKPRVTVRDMHRSNDTNGSFVDGSTTTEDIARGDRYTAILLDEAAAMDFLQHVMGATRAVTDCRFFLSTIKRTSTRGGSAFAELLANETFQKVTLSWLDHPKHSAGAYRWREDTGELEVLDKIFYEKKYHWSGEGLPDYVFRKPAEDKPGQVRSPWLDLEEDRSFDRLEVNREILIDLEGSDKAFFPREMVEGYKIKHGRDPRWTGAVAIKRKKASRKGRVYQTYTIKEFSGNPRGNLLWWGEWDIRREPPKRKYVISADVAAGGGGGTSESVLDVWDVARRAKILRFAAKRVYPNQLADLAIALGNWFHGAVLIWERNGSTGSQFTAELRRRRYPHLFRPQSDQIDKKRSKKPGFGSTADSKDQMLGAYGMSLKTNEIVNPDCAALDQCLAYVYMDNGHVAHKDSVKSEDPTMVKDNHGDRVIADALGNWAMMQMAPMTDVPETEPDYGPNNPHPWSVVARVKAQREKARETQMAGVY